MPQHIGFLGTTHKATKQSMLERVRNAMRAGPGQWRQVRRKPKPKTTHNSSMPKFQEPNKARKNVYAESKVLADLVSRGLVKREQLKDRMDHLEVERSVGKRSLPINEREDPLDVCKQMKLNTFDAACGSQTSPAGSLPNRKRKAEVVDVTLIRTSHHFLHKPDQHMWI